MLKDGRMTYENGTLCAFAVSEPSGELSAEAHDTFRVRRLRPEDFAGAGRRAVIGMVPGEIVSTDNGYAEGVDPERDILKIADNELEFMTGTNDYTKGVEILRESYDIPLIFVTLGKEGSRAYYRDLMVEVAPFLQEHTIETTGAGDTFEGCALNFVLEHGLETLTESDLRELLTFANAGASLITMRKGALRVMPSQEEIRALIAWRG